MTIKRVIGLINFLKKSWMVEAGKSFQVSASAFVGKTSGKLKSFYRIGKVLGTGKG